MPSEAGRCRWASWFLTINIIVISLIIIMTIILTYSNTLKMSSVGSLLGREPGVNHHHRHHHVQGATVFHPDIILICPWLPSQEAAH